MSQEPQDKVTTEVDRDPLVGAVLSSRYRIDRMLGTGGMGAVYLAQHVKLQKPMAVKVLHKDMSTVHEVVARFEREAIAAARIDHPNVVAATDFGTLEDGSFFLVLEYIAGQSVRVALARGPLPVARALRILRQVADALSAAHEAGIVHRDLKPENVMLVDRRGKSDVVKVLDFGIAKVTYADARNAPQLTRMGAVFGTPEYMAPEQAAGLAVDARADIYALGILLFEMLDGHPPFEDPNPVAVVQMQIRDAPRALPGNVGPEVVSFVGKLLEKDVDARIQTADEVVRRADSLLQALEAPESLPVSSVGATLIAASVPNLVMSPPPPPVEALERNRATVIVSKSTLRDPEPLDRALTRSVMLGPMRVSLWVVMAALAGVVTAVVGGIALIAMLLASGTSDDDSVMVPCAPVLSSGPAASGSGALPPDSDKSVLEAAAAGDAKALAQLEARTEAARTPSVWLAIGKGKMRLGETAAGVAAYEKSLSGNPGLADDTVLRDLRRAADDTGQWDAVLRIASKHLGESGPDLIYDVYLAAGGKGDAAKRAADALGVPAIRSKASPALQVALELRDAKACPELKALLPKVQSQGDSRCTPVLDKATPTRGCGFLGLADCYPCLRGTTGLKDAAAAAKSRAAPRFR